VVAVVQEIAPLELEIVVPSGFTPPRMLLVAAGSVYAAAYAPDPNAPPAAVVRADAVTSVALDVAVIFAAVPLVFWFSVGISAATIARKSGVPLEPFGAAKK
jgi:hypothetical protein